MTIRKFVGFVVGCGGSFALVALFMMNAHVVPRGAGWIFLFISCGMLGAKLFAKPRETVEPVLKPISKRWWLLDQKLRMVLVACCIWTIAAFAIQNSYDRNMGWVVVPPAALLVLYFAQKLLVNPKTAALTDPAVENYPPIPAVTAVTTFSEISARAGTSSSFGAKEATHATLLPDSFIVAQYRANAVIQGGNCAPTGKTLDARVVEIYYAVLQAFKSVALERSESLNPSWLNFIAWKFMQVEEMLGREMFASHLAYESKKYREEGLRPEYQNDLEFAAYIVPERELVGQPNADVDRGSSSAAGARSWTSSSSGEVAERDKRSSWNMGMLFFVFLLGALAALGLWSQRSSSQSEESINATVANESSARSIANQPQPHSLTIAAIKANLRRDASAKSPSIRVMSRGDSFQPLAEANGFVKLALPDGRTGWISKSLLISTTSSTRLARYSAIQYASLPERRTASASFHKNLRPYDELLKQLMNQVASESRPSSATIAKITLLKPVAPALDIDAAVWFALEAKWHADNGAPTDALAAARAAVAANPADVDSLVALGLSAIKADDYASLEEVALVLPLIAPEATNTWVLVGARAAAKGEDALSASALRMAIEQSRNIKVTQAFLLNMAAKVNNPLIAAAFQDAVRRGDRPQSVVGMQLHGEASPSFVTRCADVRYGTPRYHEQMANLVRAAGGPMVEPGFHKYHEALVADLCRGDRGSAVALVQNGFMNAIEAEKIRAILSPHQAPLGSTS